MLLVLPVPEIISVTPEQSVITSETQNSDAESRLLQVRIDFNWGITLGSPELEIYKQRYFEQIRCRLGALGTPLSTNLTWTSPS